jgi:hypothetical protein
LYDAKTKNPRFLGLGFVKIFLMKKTIYTNPTDPIKPLLSLADKRYSACHTGESMEQAIEGVCIVFIIVLLYM